MILGIQWYYWLFLGIAIIGLIFAWLKVLSSSKERREKLKKEAEIWKRDYELREKYSVLTLEKLNDCEEIQLLHGVAMNIQVTLENAIDMNKAFDELSQEKKNIYTLEYFDEDAAEGMAALEILSESDIIKIKNLPNVSLEESSASTHRKLILAMAKDVRAVIVKLCDRLHNMRTLSSLPVEKQKQKATETMNVLIPIAHRLGINSIKSELEDLSLRYYKPDIYFEIVEKLNQSKAQRDQLIIEMKQWIDEHHELYPHYFDK